MHLLFSQRLRAHLPHLPVHLRVSAFVGKSGNARDVAEDIGDWTGSEYSAACTHLPVRLQMAAVGHAFPGGPDASKVEADAHESTRREQAAGGRRRWLLLRESRTDRLHAVARP